MRVTKSQLRDRVMLGLFLLPFFCVAGAGLILVAPELFLRGAGFVSQGAVDDIWQQFQQTAAGEPPPLSSPAPMLTAAPPDAMPDETGIPQALAGVPAGQAELTPANPAIDGGALPRVEAAPTATQLETLVSQFESSTTPAGLTISAEGYIQLMLGRQDSFATTLLIGPSTTGTPLGVMEYREAAITDLCTRWLNNCETDRYLIEDVDFRPGGMIVYGTIKIGEVWRQAHLGVAMVIGPDHRSFVPVGLVWNEMLYELPAEGPIADLYTDLFERGNTALARLTIQAEGYSLGLSAIHLTDEQLVLVFR